MMLYSESPPTMQPRGNDRAAPSITLPIIEMRSDASAAFPHGHGLRPFFRRLTEHSRRLNRNISRGTPKIPRQPAPGRWESQV